MTTYLHLLPYELILHISQFLNDIDCETINNVYCNSGLQLRSRLISKYIRTCERCSAPLSSSAHHTKFPVCNTCYLIIEKIILIDDKLSLPTNGVFSYYRDYKNYSLRKMPISKMIDYPPKKDLKKALTNLNKIKKQPKHYVIFGELCKIINFDKSWMLINLTGQRLRSGTYLFHVDTVINQLKDLYKNH